MVVKMQAGMPANGTPLTSVSGGLEQDSGENIRVLIRIRPLNEKELSAEDQSCVQPLDQQVLQINLKGQSKEFRFHQVLGEGQSQSQVFGESGLHLLLDSALDGYSSCVFAYGQTGSGKTYTMAGIEERLGRADYVSDETDGIIPRAISYLWQGMAQRQEVFYVKAAFLEIYNEQVRDLLNPSAGVRHCRWNIKSGFFVEDLLIVDCHNIDDLISVLHEGIRNRKTGSHELNADSSRSHSIMLLYFISETKTDDQHSFKKYGKIYFVDLAGSERLKETKSQGDMIKETGNINKSLFTLGKVISALGDKKQRLSKAHIPYRDSKLTMLLMDSLGGNSKALMIGCISPAAAYADETFSTLQYASRTMNIKNRPVVQMDNKEQIIFDLRRQIDLIKMENAYLQEQISRAGVAPVMNERGHSAKSGSSKLPPLPSAPHIQSSYAQKIVTQYTEEINRLKRENSEMHDATDTASKRLQSFALENQSLAMKLGNLEHVFTEYTTKGGTVAVEDKYTITNVTIT